MDINKFINENLDEILDEPNEYIAQNKNKKVSFKEDNEETNETDETSTAIEPRVAIRIKQHVSCPDFPRFFEKVILNLYTTLQLSCAPLC